MTRPGSQVWVTRMVEQVRAGRELVVLAVAKKWATIVQRDPTAVRAAHQPADVPSTSPNAVGEQPAEARTGVVSPAGRLS